MIIKDVTKQPTVIPGAILPIKTDNIFTIKIDKSIEIITVVKPKIKDAHQKNVGIILEEKKILSKCSWSPFENQTFGSNITHTFVNGVLNYRNGKILGDTNGHRLQFLRK